MPSRSLGRPPRRLSLPPQSQFRPVLEGLEDRIAPAVAPQASASLAFGPTGPVLELVRPDGTLTQYDSTGAHVLGGGVASASVAFGPAGQALLVTFQDGRLTLFDSGGAHQLGGGVRSASI